MWFVLSETIDILRNLHQKKLTFSGCPREFYHRFIYIAPSSDLSLLSLNVPLKWFYGGLMVFSNVRSENAAPFFKQIDENSFKSTNTIICNGFKGSRYHLQISLNITKLHKDENYTIMTMYMKSCSCRW